MRELDVLIVTYQADSLLAECLAAVSAQTWRAVRVVVVVSSDVAVNLPQGVELIRTEGPADFAPAANLGLSAMGERAVVLLNDDTRPDPHFLEMLATASTEPGIYQPRILLEDGTVDNTGHRLFWDGFNIARDRGALSTRPAERCGAFSGAAVLFTPEVLAEVGFFDPDFGAFGEDVDLSLRATRQGFPIHHVPEAIITHRLGATYGRTNPRKIFLVERNRTRAAVRSLPLISLAAFPATSALRISLMGAAALTGKGLGAGAGLRGALAAIAGIAAGVSGVPAAWSKRREDRVRWSTDDVQMCRHLFEQRAPFRSLFGPDISVRSPPPATDRQSQQPD
jgi:GT2 family glycosyltransferase